MTITLKEPVMSKPPSRPDAIRDGWAFDVDDNCPLHGRWGELAE